MSKWSLMPVILISACAARVSPTSLDGGSATLRSAECSTGGYAVEIDSVTALVTGAEFNNRTGPRGEAQFAVLHLRPGRYDIEALCVRGRDGCGLGHAAVLYTDHDPSYRVRVSSGASLVADCESGGKVVRFSQ